MRKAAPILPVSLLLFWAASCAMAEEPPRTSGRPLNFENDIEPIFARFGCNSSGCHGKAEGQNGFKLSVFGFDPEADYRALAMEARGRRIFPAAPDRSLLLLKATGTIPHGGGARIDPARPEYKTLRNWIAAGMPRGSPDDPKLVRIEVSPREVVASPRGEQALQVHAFWSDGREEDVTPLARFQSNNEALAVVDEQGVVTVGESPGDVAVMASYLGQVDVFRAMIPQQDPLPADANFAESNFIDYAVNTKLRKLNIAPSGICDDATFLRRGYLDVIGTLPTATEARRFFSDQRSDRRERLIDELLDRPEFADYQTLQWADLLRVDRRALGRKQAYAYYQWIHRSFAENKPLDQFARELIAAEGPLQEFPAGHFYQVVSQPNEMASTLSQVFLGVRIECAQCHHHPWDRWGQEDYYGMQAFFTQVGKKETEHGIAVTRDAAAATKHPRTGAVIFAHPLGEPPPEQSPPEQSTGRNRREQLAAWMTALDNPWFARNLANRTWGRFLGRGLVEPVDDFRLTNPPTNPELLDALAAHLVERHFDLKALIRAITSSRTYQRSTQPNSTNGSDEQNYSRFPMRPLGAEVLFDAVCQTTGVPEKFIGVPDGVRAIQLWDSRVPHYFLELFGRPTRSTACECERVSEPTVSQVLHVLNSPDLDARLSHAGGRLSLMEREIADDAALVEELYLTFFSRAPSDAERTQAVGHLQEAAERSEAVEDVAWTMLNSLEFLFNH